MAMTDPSTARIDHTVLLFAGIKQRMGTDQLVVSLAPDATVAQLVAALCAQHPEIAGTLRAARVAVDQAFADPDTPIRPGAEIAVIPPVSGGHDGIPTGDGPTEVSQGRARLTSAPLELAAVVAAVEHRGAGGLTTFIGNVREHSRGKTVRFLEYEAYPPMAVGVMHDIAAAIEAELPGTRVAIHHRVGHLEIGEAAVIIAASAPHRDEAFRACRAAIERLKQDVPIWKKEVDTNGEAWIGQGP